MRTKRQPNREKRKKKKVKIKCRKKVELKEI